MKDWSIAKTNPMEMEDYKYVAVQCPSKWGSIISRMYNSIRGSSKMAGSVDLVH